VLYSITKHAMRRSVHEICATSISFRPKVCLAIRHRLLTEFFPPIESARQESNRAHGSLERAHASPRGDEERTTEPQHVSPRRREACRNSQIPQDIAG